MLLIRNKKKIVTHAKHEKSDKKVGVDIGLKCNGKNPRSNKHAQHKANLKKEKIIRCHIIPCCDRIPWMNNRIVIITEKNSNAIYDL